MMEAQGWGRIIGVTSFGSTRVFQEYGIVGVSKAAIDAIVRYLAVELAPKGIIANAVSPGIVNTDALKYFPLMSARHSRRVPGGRQPVEWQRLKM